MNKTNASRRAFLRRASLLSGACASGGGIALNLAGIGEAAAQSAPSDYKAIVCLFMFGGCDNANTVLAYDQPSWAAYSAARTVLPSYITLSHPSQPVAGQTILPIGNADTSLNGGRALGLHPHLGAIKSLYDAGKAAVIANVGPLKQPTTKSQFLTRGHPLPPKLFSHNDQQSSWMAFGPEGATAGWGGRLGDLFMANNQNPVFTSISAGSSAVFGSGRQTVPFQVGAQGAVAIEALSDFWTINGVGTALSTLSHQGRRNLFEHQQNRMTARSMDARDAINAAIALAPSFTEPFPQTDVGGQLAAVARIIAGRSSIGQRRQIFFVGMGGFDTHDGLIHRHGVQMARFDAAVSAFQSAMRQIGTEEQVTLFTGSDFGRTLSSNGRGSDHGWGSHHFVIGGAVRGGRVYGRFPELGDNTNDDVGHGRLLPALSVDQFAGSLGRWFGASDSDLLSVMPNLGNFGGGGSDAARVSGALTGLSMFA